MNRSIGVALLVLASASLGCSGADTAATATPDETDDLASNALAMPKAVRDFENARMWGNHHILWHTERQWNLLDPSDLAWAKKQGWKAATLQEGVAGNGLEFLAMHRVMLSTLRAAFPSDASLFVGWPTVPTNPHDPTATLPDDGDTPFDSNMAKALAELTSKLTSFASDDALGLYIETTLRPTASNADARSSDPTVGIHNYMHNRLADSSSKIDLGDPSVNLQNKLFWRLHGWIDARWTAYRTAKHLTDSDPVYKAAMAKATADVPTKVMDGVVDGAMPGMEAPPASLLKFFEQNQQ